MTSPRPAASRRRRPNASSTTTGHLGHVPGDAGHATARHGQPSAGNPTRHGQAAGKASGQPAGVSGGGRSGRGGTSPRSGARGRPSTAAAGTHTVQPGLPAPTVQDAALLPRTFAELDLPAPVVNALTRGGITELFPIQAATLPDSLAGRDVLGRGRTGSGKTLAFGLALLTRLAPAGPATAGRPHGLVLVPTRELAQQVSDALAPYAAALRVRIATVVGGLSIERQISTLRQGVDVLVATPGRLEDLIARRACRLDGVRIAVLDEADQMADMGFLPTVTRIMDQVAPGGQRLLFSATLDGDVAKLVHRFMTDPVLHSADPVSASVDTMAHHVLHLEADDKTAVTAEIAAGDSKVIMFVRTKHGADRLAKQLARVGVRAAALHGGKSQNARTRALDLLKDGALDALIATNVAARGIHIDGIDLVVNVDPPTEAKDYLHRGGRTARAGNSGTVVTLVLPEQRGEVSRMMASVDIRPEASRVRPGDATLVQVTGARQPSGEAILPPGRAPAQPPARSTTTRSTTSRSATTRSTAADFSRSTGRGRRANPSGGRRGW